MSGYKILLFQKIIKSTRSRGGEERDSTMEREHERAVAVYSRLKFSRLFFSTLLAISKEKCTGLPEAQKLIAQLQELLPILTRTIDLGVTPPTCTEEGIDYPTITGFEPLVNQRLLPPTFPRYTKIRSRSDTWDYIGELLQRLVTICSVTEHTFLHNTLVSISDFKLKCKPSAGTSSTVLLSNVTVYDPGRGWSTLY